MHDEIAKSNADFKKYYESLKAFRNNGCLRLYLAEYDYDSFVIRHARG